MVDFKKALFKKTGQLTVTATTIDKQAAESEIPTTIVESQEDAGKGVAVPSGTLVGSVRVAVSTKLSMKFNSMEALFEVTLPVVGLTLENAPEELDKAKDMLETQIAKTIHPIRDALVKLGELTGKK